MAAPPAEPTAATKTGLVGLGRWRARELFRRLPYLLAAPLLALVCTVVALLQQPQGNPESPPRGWRAWLHPRESNAWMRVASGSGGSTGEEPAFTHMSVSGRTVALTVEGGGLLWSEDGGWTWRSLRLPDSAQAVSIALASEQHAYAAARGGRLYETRDRGVSWSLMSVPYQQQEPWQVAVGGDGSLWVVSNVTVWRRMPGQEWQYTLLPLVSALVPAQGTPLPEPPAQGQPPVRRLSVSADGKRAWVIWEYGAVLVETGEHLSVQPDSKRSQAHVARHFQAQQSWWVKGEDLYLGDSRKVLPPSGGRARPEFTDLYFSPGDERGWLLGGDGWVYRTAGADLQWQSTPLQVGEPLLQVEMASKVGWIRGASTLWRTDDGGQSWYLQLAGSRRFTAALLLDRGDELWAGTSTGTLLHSKDEGETWESQRLDGEVLWLGSAQGERLLLALTRGGLWRSTDEGKRWDKVREGRFDFAHFDLEQGRLSLFEYRQEVSSPDWGERWKTEERDPKMLQLHLQELFDTSKVISTPPLAEGSVRSLGSSDSGLLSVALEGWRMPVAWAKDDSAVTLVGRLSSEVERFGQVHGFYRSGASQVWAYGKGGLLLVKEGEGGTWRRVASGTTADIHAMLVGPRGRHLWLFGEGNALLRSDDGGRTWESVRNEVSLPRWYFLSWGWVALVGAWSLWRMRAASQPSQQETVANLLVSDKPIEDPRQDVMGLTALAQGLSNFIRNERTQPPLTLAITGEWGTGKSSVLNLLRNDLAWRGFRPVWFNAWHHQQEENLLAALYAAIISQSVPPFPRPEALEFRLRLLVRRSGRMVALLSVLLLVLTWAAAFFLRNPEQVDVVATRVQPAFELLFNAESSRQAAEAPPASGLTLPAAAGVVTSLLLLLRKLLQGFSAFGVDPARVLASLEGSASLRDVRERVSFQARFAEDFKDVTESLGARRMVLLIDDLDRCTPENVVKMLEAINFLVSSGACFVVLAISRRVIEEYVALQLGEVAERLAPAVELPVAEGQPAPTEGQVRQARRLAYARQYLEKLLNVELPIPPFTEQHAARLAQEPEGEPVEPVQSGRRTYRWTLAFVLGAMALTLAGWWGWSTRAPVRALVAMAGQETAAVTGAPPATSSPVDPSTPGQEGNTVGKAERPQSEWRIVQGRSSEPPGVGGPLALMGLVLGLLALQGRLLFPAEVVVRDSKPFAESLAIWRPVIMLDNRTPRSVKRFLNRVRFFAMCQRALHRHAARPAVLGWKARVRDFVRWLRRLPEPRVSEAESPERSREHLLVALATLHEVAPEVVADAGFYQALQERAERYGALSIPPAVHAAWGRYAERFGSEPPPPEELETFVRLTGSVQVR
jgi:photosystem II stability/assembly factor-like uncharacterized protein